MIDQIKSLMKKYEEIIAYLIVGVLTTLVSWGCQFLWSYIAYGNPTNPTPGQNFMLTTVNWVSGVIFAFFTNRKYVFKSNGPMGKEAVKFVTSRISTYFMDLILRQIMGAMKIDVYITTLAIAVIVTVCNYIFSKIFVFKKAKPSEEKTAENKGTAEV